MIDLNQKGYAIKIVLIAFAVLIGMMLFPMKFPLKSGSGCQVGEPGDHSTITMPAVKDMLVTSMDPNETYNTPDQGGPDPNAQAQFVQLRRNVPTSKKSTPSGWEFIGGTTPTDLTHTVESGEFPQKPGYIAYYPMKWGEIDIPGKGMFHIRRMGLLLFANPALTKTTPDGNTIYMMDVYQDARIYNFADKGYTEQDMFLCGVDTKVGSTSVVFPGQEVSSTKDQLQLEWFLFNTDKLWAVHCKPAVYLYPEKKQLVNVKVYPKGELSYTDPPYDPQNGWAVWAEPSGGLFDSQTMSPVEQGYLYYESKLLDSEIKKPSQGWVIQKSEMENLFNNILPKLGLNEKEEKDFKDYWLTKLPESPYYFVGVIEKNQRDYLERLDVTPNPETSIRFSLFFEPLNEFKNVEEPIINTPTRTGFTLVDWGGMIKLHKETPFTCSQ